MMIATAVSAVHDFNLTLPVNVQVSPTGQLLRCWAGSVGTIINSAETLPKTTAYVLT